MWVTASWYTVLYSASWWTILYFALTEYETLLPAREAPRVIGSLNQSWFAWGAGSESHNTKMFAFNPGSCEVTYLGDASGYSHPTVAQECDAIMAPVTHGTGAVSFRVGTLG